MCKCYVWKLLKKWEKVLQFDTRVDLSCIYWLDACDVKNKHITKDDLHIININVSMWSLFLEDSMPKF
jgi:hypothetical protein